MFGQDTTIVDPFKFDITEVQPSMSNKDYHSRDEISSSFIKSVCKHSIGKALVPLDQEMRALILGDAFHDTVEKGELDTERFAIKPEPSDKATISVTEVEERFGYIPPSKDIFQNEEGVDLVKDTSHDGRTKMGKAWNKENSHKTILSHQEVTNIYGMKKSLEENESLRAILDHPNFESRDEWSFFGEGDDGNTKGLKFRVRPDRHIINKKTGGIEYIFDWKSCIDLNKLIRWGFKDLGYDVQAVFYSDFLGVNPRKFIFFSVEKEPPYSCRPIILSEDTIVEARMKMLPIFSSLKKWKKDPDNKENIDINLPKIIEI